MNHNKSISLDRPTNDAKVIFKYAMLLYERNFLGINVRLVGVTLQNLVSNKEVAIQMNLFSAEEEEDKTKVLINDINRGYDKPVVMRASEVKKDK